MKFNEEKSLVRLEGFSSGKEQIKTIPEFGFFLFSSSLFGRNLQNISLRNFFLTFEHLSVVDLRREGGGGGDDGATVQGLPMRQIFRIFFSKLSQATRKKSVKN